MMIKTTVSFIACWFAPFAGLTVSSFGFTTSGTANCAILTTSAPTATLSADGGSSICTIGPTLGASAQSSISSVVGASEFSVFAEADAATSSQVNAMTGPGDASVRAGATVNSDFKLTTAGPSRFGFVQFTALFDTSAGSLGGVPTSTFTFTPSGGTAIMIGSAASNLLPFPAAGCGLITNGLNCTFATMLGAGTVYDFNLNANVAAVEFPTDILPEHYTADVQLTYQFYEAGINGAEIPVASQVVPEPATVSLAVFGLMVVGFSIVRSRRLSRGR